MTRFNDTVEQKTNKERPIEEMTYQSTLDWRYMKKLRSETKVRHWHIKVARQSAYDGRPVYEDYNVAQVWMHRKGEYLFGYRASRSGRPLDLMDKVFEARGQDHLHGIEYLLRSLEGQDISNLRLHEINKDYIG